MPTHPLDELLRWERSGGTWELESDIAGVLILALLPCTGGDRVGEIVGDAADLRAYVLARR